MGIALGTSGTGQAALDYDTDSDSNTLEELTRFEIDGDPIPGTSSNTAITLAPGVDGDWNSSPYGPQPIGDGNSGDAPAGIGSSGLLPLLFDQIVTEDFPEVSPAPNPTFGVPNLPNNTLEFCVPDNEDSWVGGMKFQRVSIDNPLFDTAGNQALQCGNVLGKGDLFRTYAAYEVVSIPNVYGDPNAGSQNHVIVYGGWERGEVPGELNFYIPLADAVAGNSAGDRLIAFDYDSSKPASYRILAWNGSTWVVTQSGNAAVNGEVFAAAVGNADGSSFSGGNAPSFGEFAIDITAAGILPNDDGECVTLTTAGFVFTETGNSSNAQLKDFVGAPRIPISNCGSLEVTKAGPDVGTSPDFAYRVEQQDSLAIQPGVNQIDDTFVLGETVQWDDVFAQPDYLAFEEPVFISGNPPADLPAGWDMISIECTYVDATTLGYPIVTETMWDGARTLDGNGNETVFAVQSSAVMQILTETWAVDPTLAVGYADSADDPAPGTNPYDGFVAGCTITNTATGVVVNKVVDGDTDVEFPAIQINTVPAVAAGTPDPLTGGDGTDVLPFEDGDPVTVSEASVPAGWELVGITCTYVDADGVAQNVAATADGETSVSFAAVLGAIIECDVTNQQLGQIVVTKTASGADPLPDFSFDHDFAPDTTLDGASDATIPSGDQFDSGFITPGTYHVTELIDLANPADGPDFDGSYVCTSANGVEQPVPSGLEAEITLTGGDTVTCAYTNIQQGRLTIEKTMIDGPVTGDAAANFTFSGDVTGSIDLVNGTGTDSVTGTVTTVDQAPGTYVVTEDAAPGYTLTAVNCTGDDNSTGDVNGRSATFVVDPGDDITCEFVNTRNSATFTLEKTWGPSTPDGDTVNLGAVVSDGSGPVDAPIDVDATADGETSVYDPVDPLEPTPTSMIVYSGQTITFDEAFVVGSANAYTSTIVCSTEDGINITTDGDDNQRDGTYAVPAAPGDVTCTFDNVPKTAGVTLRKEWIDARTGQNAESASFSLSTDPGGASDSDTSTATSATFIDNANTALVSVVDGDTVTMTETSLTNAEDYNTSIACVGTDSVPVPVVGVDRSWTITIDTEDVSTGAAIVCTITNTRKTATLELTKSWGTSPISTDAVDLSISQGDTELGAVTSTSNVAPTPISIEVLVGDTYDISEAAAETFVAENYDSSWSCTDNAATSGTGLTGSVEVTPDDEGDTIRCTFLNQRYWNTLTFQKNWVDGAAGDTTTITATPGLSNGDSAEPVVPVGGDGVSDAKVTGVTVWAGDTVVLDEDPIVGYDITAFDCSAGTPDAWSPNDADLAVAFSAADVESAITCTVTNTRKSAQLDLAKAWVDPVGGPEVTITADGDDAYSTEGIDESTNSPTPTSGSMLVYSGETVTIEETFTTAADLDLFDTTLVCNGELVDIAENVDGTWTASIAAGDDPQATSCTFTNTRRSTQLTYQKRWLDGDLADSATLTYLGTDEPGSSPAVATVASTPDASGDGVSAETIVSTVYAGETITLSEAFGDNVGTYDVAGLFCRQGANPVGTPDPLTWTWDQGDPITRDFTFSGTDVATPITCSVVNERVTSSLLLVKSWDDPVPGPATVTLTGTVVDDTTGGQVTVDAPSPAGVLSSPLTVASGETVLVDEVFDVLSSPDLLGREHYDVRLECVDANDGTYVSIDPFGDDVTDLSASFEVPATAEDLTCTFTNTRKRTNLVVAKAWTNEVIGDSVDLSIETDTDPATTATAVGGGASDATASIVAYSGADYDLTEVINESDNDALYTPVSLECTDASPATGFTGDGTGATGNVLVDPADTGEGAELRCTFTNRALRGNITIIKDVVGGDGVTDFGFEGTWDGEDADPADFTLTPPTDGSAQQVFTDVLVPNDGTPYTITELDPGALYGTTVSCTGDDPGGLASGPNPADSGRVGTIGLDDGESITCRFTNTQNGIVIIEKVADTANPDLLSQAFSFTETGLGDGTFTLTDDPTLDPAEDTIVFDNVVPGEGYTVTELPTEGWDLTGLTCTDGDSATPSTIDGATATINVDPAEVVRCTYTNTARAQIVTEKTTVPAEAAGDFGFEASWNGDADTVADFTLADGGSNNSGFLLPDVAYTVTELAAPGFALTDVQCDSDTGSGSVETSSATITPAPGEIVTCEFTNSQRGPVTIAKDAVTDITRDGTTYSVTYEITVSSESYIDELFDLTDSPDMAANVTVTSMVVNGPGVTDHDIVADGELVVDDGTIPARAGQADGPDALVYTVVTTFTMTPSNSNQECVDGQGGNGAYNSATVTFEEPPTTNSDDACVDLPTPDISVEKVADGALATQVDGFQYQAVYTVTVTNDGEGPGSYTLADLPDFASGPVDSVTLDPVPDPTSNVLEAGGEDVYTVTVLFTVDGELDLDLRPCGTEPTPGQGGYNGVTVTYGPTPNPTDDACVNIPDPNISVTKVRTSDTATLVGGTVYSAEYTVTVTNTGSGPGAYSVLDVPVVAGDGVISTTIVPEPAATTAIEAGGSDVYTVTVLFDVPGDLTSDERTCVETRDEAGSGAYNGVTVTWNGEQTSTDEDCVDIPNPNVEHDKVVVGDGAVYNGDNNWTVTYDVTVTNLDPDANDDVPVGPSQYTLTDSFDFGPGATVNSVTVTPNPDTLLVNGAFDGEGDTTLATDVLIEADATHTYTISVDVDVVPTEGTNGDCTTDGGFRNAAGITVASDGQFTDRVDQEACAPFSVLTLVKEVLNDDGGDATVDQFTLTATLDGTEILSGDTVVTESVPAGDYVLAETQLPGYTTEGFTCGEATMDGQTVTVADGASVTCTIVNDDEPVDLAITKNDDGVTAIAGGAPFDYTITVQNVGTRDADLGEPVTVVDELPLPLQWVSFPANCEQAGQTLTCDIDPALMTAGGAPVVITATVSAPADAASGTYVNQASVTTEDDPVCEPIGDCEPPPCEEAASNNNIDCEPTPVDREGAIQIVKTDNVAAGESVLPGEQYNYTLRVTNTGVSTILPGLVVTDDLPAQLSLVSVSGGAGWTCNNADPIECTYAPSLAPGASAPNITVVVSVNADATGTEIDNTAVVQGAVDRECPEPTSGADLSEAFVPACNQVTDDDDETTPLTAQADLAIDKTASVATVGAGGGFNWVLVVENLGPAPAIDVVVGDLVPSAVTVTGVTSSFFDCSRSGNDVTCTRPEMAVGASGTITIAVTVPTNAEGGNVDNLGRVEASTPDPNLDNNSDDATVVVVAQIPPTSVTPTIPATGSNSTEPVVKTALVLLMLGALGLVAARRRRPDGVTPTA